jgi:hypothetical protein
MIRTSPRSSSHPSGRCGRQLCRIGSWRADTIPHQHLVRKREPWLFGSACIVYTITHRFIHLFLENIDPFSFTVKVILQVSASLYRIINFHKITPSFSIVCTTAIIISKSSLGKQRLVWFYVNFFRFVIYHSM